jgi:hypothetical protein
VGVVTVVGLVFNVGGADGDTTLTFFRRFVDGPVFEVSSVPFLRLPLGDGGREGRLE